MTGKKILLIEDEVDIAELMAMHLKDGYFEVTMCHDGDAGLARAQAGGWDLIVLDIRLPGTDGLDICKQLRANGDRTPMMIVSSKSTELDRVLGLELGADDYLVKPFSVLELMARVKALFRRVGGDAQIAANDAGRLSIGALEINPAARSVRVGAREIELTAREFDLLLHFARAPGRVFQRAELLDQVWGYGYEGYEHTVNSHINRLRAKIEKDPSEPDYIVTVWGVGYKLARSA